jgi:alpha-amylase
MGMNVDQANPEVVDEIKKWGAWYFNTTHFDGLRLDAVKHISSDFYRDVLRELRARAIEALREAGGAQQNADKATTEAGGAQQEDMPIALTEAGGEQQDVETAFPVVGEYWHGDVGRLLDYLDRVENLMSLFDVPLHYNFYQASLSGGSFSMRGIFNNTLVSARPSNAVTFVDNHDTQVGQALQSFVEDWFKPLAYAMILLRKDGVPCVFYTDYYGNPARNIPVVPNLGRLIKLRAGVAYGEQVDYFDDDHVVGWVRRGDEEHAGSGLAVLLSSGAGGTKRMEMGKKFAGMQFHDALGICQETVTIDADGFGEFRTEGGNVSVWTNYEVFADMVVNE